MFPIGFMFYILRECFVNGHDIMKVDSIFHIQRHCALYNSSTPVCFMNTLQKTPTRICPWEESIHKSNYDYQKCFHRTCKLYGLNVQGPNINTKWDEHMRKTYVQLQNVFYSFLLYIKSYNRHVRTQYSGSLLEVHSTYLR